MNVTKKLSSSASSSDEDTLVIDTKDDEVSVIAIIEKPSENETSQPSMKKPYNIFHKLPPGTIVMKNGAILNTETHKPYEFKLRRNPTRGVTKKQCSTTSGDENFLNLRQRLLSTSKKKPYMNTRSVTRKMYNVGATFQPATIKDEKEWKEWPCHGMHERPVFHPQVGLANEYLGKYFTSLDGKSYNEIIDRPDVQIVLVDPNKNNLEDSSIIRTFGFCMHDSLHHLLSYCSSLATTNHSFKTFNQMRISLEHHDYFHEKSPSHLKLASNHLRELLEDTSILYCAATGTHQIDLARYIDTLDNNQSLKWLNDM